VLRNQPTPRIIDSRVVLFRNILTPSHSVRVRVRVKDRDRVRGSIRVRGQFIPGVKIFRDTGQAVTICY